MTIQPLSELGIILRHTLWIEVGIAEFILDVKTEQKESTCARILSERITFIAAD